MACAPRGLTQGQAALLLRCQERRDARLRAEQGRCAAATAQTQTDVAVAEDAAARHAGAARGALQRAYNEIVGQTVDPWAVLAVRQAEEAGAERQADLEQQAAAAHDALHQADLDEVVARERRTEGARQLARRERVHEAVSLDANGRRIFNDEAQADETYLVLRARRR